jgi:hypothetical protein
MGGGCPDQEKPPAVAAARLARLAVLARGGGGGGGGGVGRGVGGEVVNKAVGGLAGGTGGEVAGVVFDATAVSDCLQLQEVPLRALHKSLWCGQAWGRGQSGVGTYFL